METEFPLNGVGAKDRTKWRGRTHWTKTGVIVITLEEVLSPENMLIAGDRVMGNKGASEIDGMTVDKLPEHFRQHGPSICEHIPVVKDRSPRTGLYALEQMLF